MSVLKVAGLTKRFGDVLAVDDLGFAVAPGEIFGFLGGNGAGKTTTLRMVLDIIRPTSGSIEVLGQAPGRRNTGAIGFLPEERGLYSNMNALEVITYFGQLKQMRAADARSHGRELLARFGLADRAKARISELSKGMAQKVQLAAALVNRPKLLILDEPFSGLDPVNQGLLEEEILRASGEGAAVVFSTHVMQHAEPVPAAAAAAPGPQAFRRHARRGPRAIAVNHRRRGPARHRRSGRRCQGHTARRAGRRDAGVDAGSRPRGFGR